jgi:hypothetical protein
MPEGHFPSDDAATKLIYLVLRDPRTPLFTWPRCSLSTAPLPLLST